MPGLPALARAEPLGPRAQNKVALRFSGLALAAALLYLTVMLLGGSQLLPLLFGQSFEQYTDLLWPLAVGQLAAATGVGLGLLLKARSRGSALLVSRGTGSATEFLLVAPLSSSAGTAGAAWAGAASQLTATAMQAWLVFRRSERTAEPTIRVAGASPGPTSGMRQPTP
jgi:O-antigen/teichoic acid export membrane protein